MQDLSLHILDVAENAIRAEAKTVTIKIVEDERNERLTLSIGDDGVGMDKETADRVLDPFFTTKGGKKVGLGLSLLAQAAKDTGGDLKVDSKETGGTTITAVFNPNHPDMKPMGDVLETVAALMVGNPGVRFIFDHEKGENSSHFDSHEGEVQHD